MANTRIGKINDKVQEIIDTGLMSRGNRNATSADLACAIEHGNIDSCCFLDKLEAEVVAWEIYKREMYRTPMTDDDFRRVAKVAAMIPLNAEDEDNDELVVGILLDAYINGKNLVNTFFSFLPEQMQKADGVWEDLEDTLDWIDLEINLVCDNPVFLSHDRAEKEIRDSLSFYDEEGTLLSEADIKALTEIFSRLPLAEESIGQVAAELVGSYCDTLSDIRTED